MNEKDKLANIVAQLVCNKKNTCPYYKDYCYGRTEFEECKNITHITDKLIENDVRYTAIPNTVIVEGEVSSGCPPYMMNAIRALMDGVPCDNVCDNEFPFRVGDTVYIVLITQKFLSHTVKVDIVEHNILTNMDLYDCLSLYERGLAHKSMEEAQKAANYIKDKNNRR